MKVLIGFGSNLGDRWAHLQAAATALRSVPHLRVVAFSAVYETPPWGGLGDTVSPAYLNACALLEVDCSVDAVLGACLGIEAALGRKRDAAHQFAPRVIDLDVLFACKGDAVIHTQSPLLTLPHPRLALRAFALKPALALWSHPQLQAWFADSQVQADALEVQLVKGQL